MQEIGNLRSSTHVCPVDFNGTSVFIHGRAPIETSPFYPLIFVPDINDTPSQALQVCEDLAKEGFKAFTFDLRLHRKQLQKRYIPAKELASDLLQVVAWVRSKTKRNPILVGQGVGAILCVYVAQNHHHYLTGLIFSGPCFQFIRPIGSYQRFIIRFLAKTFGGMRTPRWLYPFRDEGSWGEELPSLKLTYNIVISMARMPKLLFRTHLPTLWLVPRLSTHYVYDYQKVMDKNGPKEVFAQIYETPVDRILTCMDPPFSFQELTPWILQIQNSKKVP